MSAYATAILLQGDNEHVSPWNVKFMFLISNYFFIFPKRVQMEYKIPPEKGLPYPLQCNPGVLFFKIGFWVRFYSNLNLMGLYLSWGSIN